MLVSVLLHANPNYALNFGLSQLFAELSKLFWPLGMPWEKAYSYFIINDEHWAFSVI